MRRTKSRWPRFWKGSSRFLVFPKSSNGCYRERRRCGSTPSTTYWPPTLRPGGRPAKRLLTWGPSSFHLIELWLSCRTASEGGPYEEPLDAVSSEVSEPSINLIL